MPRPVDPMPTEEDLAQLEERLELERKQAIAEREALPPFILDVWGEGLRMTGTQLNPPGPLATDGDRLPNPVGLHLFYCVLPYDLTLMGYSGEYPSASGTFHWDGANRRWYVHLRSFGGPGAIFTMTRTTVTNARAVIAAEVQKLPSGGTVLAVQYAIDHEKSDVVGDRLCDTDVHMLPFADGENFNRDHQCRDTWCPSSADSDWPLIERTNRFDRSPV